MSVVAALLLWLAGNPSPVVQPQSGSDGPAPMMQVDHAG